MFPAQVHHPDLVAQAAGFLDRDNYVNELGIDPDHNEKFRAMADTLWSWLPSQVEQLREVHHVQ